MNTLRRWWNRFRWAWFPPSTLRYREIVAKVLESHPDTLTSLNWRREVLVFTFDETLVLYRSKDMHPVMVKAMLRTDLQAMPGGLQALHRIEARGRCALLFYVQREKDVEMVIGSMEEP